MESDAQRLQKLEKENLRLRRAVEELSVLNELAASIVGSRTSEEVIEQIVQKSVKTIGAEQGLVTLVDDTMVDPTQTLVRSVSSSSEHAILSPNQSLVGWMILNKKPLVINDPHEDERFGGTRWDPSIRSILCTPLLIQGRLLGVITLYNKKDDEGFTDDDKRLMSILSLQSAQTLEAARLYEEESLLTQIQEQLRLARNIQMRLLPGVMPDVAGYDIAGTSKPAQSVGGDLYDVVQVSDDYVAFWIGDVSGKGLPASLTMANTQAVFRTNAMAQAHPEQAIARTDELLCQYTRRGTFVTSIFVVLNPVDGTFRFSNAGHVKPVLIRTDGSAEMMDESSLVMGFDANVPRTSSTASISIGETLVLYTDGIGEAMNEQRALLGDEIIIKLIADNAQRSSSEIVQLVMEKIEDFAGKAPQADDITILVLRRISDI